MKVDAEPVWLETIDPGARNRLTTNNSTIVSGKDTVITNPSYEEVSDDDVKDMVEAVLDAVELTDFLRQVELDNRERMGPRSLAKPWAERKESLLAYFDKSDYDPGGFGQHSGSLRPSDVASVSKSLIKSSSAGLPYLERKGNVLGDAISNWQSQEGVYPCMLYTRTQEQGKTRNVWGYPISDTIAEQRYYMPWSRYERDLQWRSALRGPEAVDNHVTQLLRAKSSRDKLVTLDFSAFDASIQPEYSYEAFAVIAALFQPSYHAELYGLFRRFVTIPVFTPDGEVSGIHGVPSGSSWTNTIDSFVQFLASGSRVSRCQVQGDDGVYLVAHDRLETFRDRFTSIGLTVNDEKSHVFDGVECMFLQRYYHPTYKSVEDDTVLGGVYSAYRAFTRIKYLEHWSNFERMEISGRDFFSLRTIMILENCKHHPAFEDLVRIAHALDGEGLRFSNEGVKAYSRSLESKARAGVISATAFDQGVNSFKTLKVLRTLW